MSGQNVQSMNLNPQFQEFLSLSSADQNKLLTYQMVNGFLNSDNQLTQSVNTSREQQKQNINKNETQVPRQCDEFNITHQAQSSYDKITHFLDNSDKFEFARRPKESNDQFYLKIEEDRLYEELNNQEKHEDFSLKRMPVPDESRQQISDLRKCKSTQQLLENQIQTADKKHTQKLRQDVYEDEFTVFTSPNHNRISKTDSMRSRILFLGVARKPRIEQLRKINMPISNQEILRKTKSRSVSYAFNSYYQNVSRREQEIAFKNKSKINISQMEQYQSPKQKMPSKICSPTQDSQTSVFSQKKHQLKRQSSNIEIPQGFRKPLEAGSDFELNTSQNPTCNSVEFNLKVPKEPSFKLSKLQSIEKENKIDNNSIQLWQPTLEKDFPQNQKAVGDSDAQINSKLKLNSQSMQISSHIVMKERTFQIITNKKPSTIIQYNLCEKRKQKEHILKQFQDTTEEKRLQQQQQNWIVESIIQVQQECRVDPILHCEQIDEMDRFVRAKENKSRTIYANQKDVFKQCSKVKHMTSNSYNFKNPKFDALMNRTYIEKLQDSTKDKSRQSLKVFEEEHKETDLPPCAPRTACPQMMKLTSPQLNSDMERMNTRLKEDLRYFNKLKRDIQICDMVLSAKDKQIYQQQRDDERIQQVIPFQQLQLNYTKQFLNQQVQESNFDLKLDITTQPEIIQQIPKFTVYINDVLKVKPMQTDRGILIQSPQIQPLTKQKLRSITVEQEIQISRQHYVQTSILDIEQNKNLVGNVTNQNLQSIDDYFEKFSYETAPFVQMQNISSPNVNVKSLLRSPLPNLKEKQSTNSSNLHMFEIINRNLTSNVEKAVTKSQAKAHDQSQHSKIFQVMQNFELKNQTTDNQYKAEKLLQEDKKQLQDLANQLNYLANNKSRQNVVKGTQSLKAATSLFSSQSQQANYTESLQQKRLFDVKNEIEEIKKQSNENNNGEESQKSLLDASLSFEDKVDYQNANQSQVKRYSIETNEINRMELSQIGQSRSKRNQLDQSSSDSDMKIPSNQSQLAFQCMYCNKTYNKPENQKLHQLITIFIQQQGSKAFAISKLPLEIDLELYEHVTACHLKLFQVIQHTKQQNAMIQQKDYLQQLKQKVTTNKISPAKQYFKRQVEVKYETAPQVENMFQFTDLKSKKILEEIPKMPVKTQKTSSFVVENKQNTLTKSQNTQLVQQQKSISEKREWNYSQMNGAEYNNKLGLIVNKLKNSKKM